jgi:hypothetical protein
MSAIRPEIAFLSTNQIAGNTIDFKMNIIMVEIMFSWGGGGLSEIKCIIFKENNYNPSYNPHLFGGNKKS